MLDKVLGFIRQNDLVREGDAVVCGLSGGADSVCLLLVMRELGESLGFSVEALHVNHMIRGAESDRDETFCRELCERLGILFTAFSRDVPKYAAEASLSLEEAARKLRYEIFAEFSKGKLIATAHNADDNLETAVLNLARGSGLKGLAGVPVKRGNIIRPLLTASRAEIEAFLAAKNQDFVTDSTNLSVDYTRNKIRHKILPLLKEINPSVVATFVNSASTLREEDAFISEQAEKAYSTAFDGSSLRGLASRPEVVRRRCLARLLAENGLPYSRERLVEADRALLNGGKINISRSFYLVSDGESVSVKEILPADAPKELSAALRIGENRLFSDKTLRCEIVHCDNLRKFESVHKKLTFYLLDYDKIIGRATVRNRRFGDKIRLKGRGFFSSVKKLVNEKIPPELRAELYFIEDEEGLVFAERIGIADRVAPDEATERFLAIETI